MSFEEALQTSMLSNNKERTFIDKLLAREDTEKLRELMKKTPLTRSDLLEILYILGSTESKLLNYGDWDRYVMLKFFVWLREFVKFGELLYDYKDDMDKREKDGKIKLTSNATQLFENNQRYIEHNIKFLVDLYLNIGRTTLSRGATGILEMLKNKYELSYPQMAALATQVQTQQQSGGWVQKLKGG